MWQPFLFFSEQKNKMLNGEYPAVSGDWSNQLSSMCRNMSADQSAFMDVDEYIYAHMSLQELEPQRCMYQSIKRRPISN